MELIIAPKDTIMDSSLKNTNVLDLWDVLVDNAQA